MSINFKKITDVPVIEEISEGDKLLVNSNGVAKLIDASKVGGGSGDLGASSTVTTYTINKTHSDFTSQGLQEFDGNAQHWLLVEGDFDGKKLFGTSYTITKMVYDDNDEGTEKTITYVIDSSMYNYSESNGLKYEQLGDLVILQEGHYSTGEWGMTVKKAGIYFITYGSDVTVNELVLSISTPIDEKYIPSTIARISQVPPNPDWSTDYEGDLSYIKGRTHYYQHPSLAESTVTYVNGENDFEHPTDGASFNELLFENRYGNGYFFDQDGEYVAVMTVGWWEETEVKFTITSGFGTIVVPFNGEEVSLRVYTGYNGDEIGDVTLPATGSFVEYHVDIQMIKAWSAPIVEKHLDDAFLSSNIQRVGDDVIINSSTEGSTKKFKITVDDSGNLTATEVE